MKKLPIIWNSTPRFLRGWFLGNLMYLVLTMAGMQYIEIAIVAELPRLLIIQPLLSNFSMRGFTPDVQLQYDFLNYLGFLLPNFFWCSLCAVFVAWKKELIGVTLAVLVMVILALLLFVWVILNFNMVML